MKLNQNDIFRQLLLGDCIECMKEIPDASVDLILADLPYGTTACSWDVIIPFDQLWQQYNRIKKPTTAIVLTASQPFTSVLINSNIGAFKYEWIWEKHQGTNFLLAKKMPLKIHENICVFYDQPPTYNPQKTFGHKAYSGFSSESATSGEVYGAVSSKHQQNDGSRYPTSILKFPKEKLGLHPTQKPLKLMEYLVLTYSNFGDVVLDNTMGSGTTGFACKLSGRSFIGIEKDPDYFKTARQRLNQNMLDDDIVWAS